MSDTKKIKLGFNTAITGIDQATGAWDEKAHNALVKPLRGLAMQTDGLVGCFIARYGMEVSFLADVTDTATVVEAVQTAVGEVSNMAGFFPLRGDKTPTATYETTITTGAWHASPSTPISSSTGARSPRARSSKS